MKSSILSDYDLCKQFAAEEDWNSALEKIRHCLTLEPDNRKYKRLFEEITTNKNAYVRLGQGRELEEIGLFEKAVELYKKELKNRSDYNKQIKAQIKIAQKSQREFDDLSKQAHHFYQSEKYTKAKSIINELLKITPRHPAIQELIREIESKEHAHILYTEAMSLHKRGQYKEAMEKVSRSLQLDPNFAAARILLSKIGATQTCNKYQLDKEHHNKKKLQETIQFLEHSAESDLEQ